MIGTAQFAGVPGAAEWVGADAPDGVDVLGEVQVQHGLQDLPGGLHQVGKPPKKVILLMAGPLRPNTPPPSSSLMALEDKDFYSMDTKYNW